MKRPWAAVLIALAACSLAFGSDTPWKDKPYRQWSQKDVTQIMLDSPWAKTVPNVGGTLSQHGNTDLSGSEPTVSPGMGGLGSGGGVLPGEHETALNDPRAPKTYSVLWWSARTVREAAARHEVLTGQLTADQMDKAVTTGPGDYEVMVRGADMSVFDQRSEQSFMDKAFLEVKSSKQKIMPIKVEYQKGPNGDVTAAIFHFAMKNSSGVPILSPSDKHIDFYCHVADGTIRTWFEPGKMVDNQGVDL